MQGKLHACPVQAGMQSGRATLIAGRRTEREILGSDELSISRVLIPPAYRVYTTNTIEALNRQIREIIKTRGSFPSEDSARKLLYLAITRAQRKWRHTYDWSSALVAFRIHFGDRIPDTAI
ncbi:MAG: transposase [Solirubrobacteraceae bacterium]